MNAIPAKVAGVERLVIACPTPDGEGEPAGPAAARIAGVDTVYRIGGAQAIAALAYGTGPSPPSTRSPAPATPMSPPPSAGSSAGSAST
jgi:histidinol dehydrogenase